jgi:hypothetical protein
LEALQLQLVVRKICSDAELAATDKCEDRLTDEQRKLFSGQTHYYQLTKRTTKYRICFSRAPLAEAIDLSWLGLSDAEQKYINTMKSDEIKANIVAPKAFCGPPPTGKTSGPKVAYAGAKAFRIAAEFVDLDRTERPADTSDVLNISIKLRSTEQIIYYLGQIARHELGMGRFADISSEAKIGKCEKVFEIPISVDGRTCARLFTVSRARLSPAISFDYLGSTYYVPISATGEDRSGQVMEIATQILNVNKSSKDFPAPSVIPVVQ